MRGTCSRCARCLRRVLPVGARASKPAPRRGVNDGPVGADDSDNKSTFDCAGPAAADATSFAPEVNGQRGA